MIKVALSIAVWSISFYASVYVSLNFAFDVL